MGWLAVHPPYLELILLVWVVAWTRILSYFFGTYFLTKVQENDFVQRRAPPPSLASLDSLNPHKSKPASLRSSPALAPFSPSLLSPPVVNVPLSSPPPQLEGEDYLSTTPQDASHRKRQHKGKRRTSSSLQQSSGIKSDRASGIEEKVFGTNSNQLVDDGTRSIDTGGSGKSPKPWPVIDTAELMIKRRGTKSFLAPSTDPQSVEGDLTATSQSKMDDEQDSAATSSLRRMSQATKAFSVSQAQHIRRISRALTTNFRIPPEKKGSIDSTATNNLDKIIVSDISKDDINAFLHATKAQTPESQYQARRTATALGRVAHDTPTTITLRKASDAYLVVIEPKGGKSCSLLDAQAQAYEPTVENHEQSVALMGFRSERRYEPRKSLWYSLPLLSDQSQQVPSEPAQNETTTAPADSPTPTACLPSIQPRTLPSETAITFSSMHSVALNAPTKRRSRNTSVSSRQRRTSTVRIQSRSSVHQIIWAEDENTNVSSGSSRNSVDSIQVQNTGPIQISGNVTSLQASRSAPASPSYKPTPFGPQHSQEENIFEWSWSASPHKMCDEELLASPLPASPVQNPRHQHSRRRPSESKDSSVESFPPLLDRKDTMEWRKAPLGDINDPMEGSMGRWMPVIGRTGECYEVGQGTPEQRDDADTKAAVEARNGRQTLSSVDQMESTDQKGVGEGTAWERRSSTHPCAPARMGERGTVGSSVGTSSHKRVSWTRL